VTDTSQSTNGAEDRRQHLDFIQTVIGRMSTTSTLAKGWCLTVATAAFGFAVTKNSRGVGLLGGLTVVLFGFLDARYLREERRFRALYDDARCGRCVAYDMNTQPYVESDNDHFDANCTWPSVMRSWSLWAFYGPLLLVTAVVVVRAWINL
jgi:histidine triad (HIT) family protein